MTTDSSTLERGLVIAGELIVHGPLDQGGMGAVYLVEQKSTGKVRALKVMHRAVALDPALRKRFEREARVGARIESDHIVDVLAAGVDAELDLPYLVMELLEGETLAHRLVDGAVPLDEVRTIFEQLCHAVGAAHAAGVVHRDLKPENIFLARTRRIGERFMVKVLDFGIAKVMAEAASATECGVGSPRWMAPEQTEPGPVGPSADVWSLGLVAFEIITGKSFWRAANMAGSTRGQLLREIVLDPIPGALERAHELDVEGKLPPSFDAWFAKCVARDPGARFRDAREAWTAMEAFLSRPAIDDSIDIVLSRIAPPPPLVRNPTQRSASWRVEATNKDTPFTTVRHAPIEAPAPTRSKRALAVAALLGAAFALALALGVHRSRTPAEPVAAAASTTTFSVTPTAIVLGETIPAPTMESTPPSAAPSPSTGAPTVFTTRPLAAVSRPIASELPPRPSAPLPRPATITTFTTITSPETSTTHTPVEISPETIALLAVVAPPSGTLSKKPHRPPSQPR